MDFELQRHTYGARLVIGDKIVSVVVESDATTVGVWKDGKQLDELEIPTPAPDED